MNKIVSKDGFYKGVQRYKGAVCGKRFIGCKRLDNIKFYTEYTKGKQTNTQLSNKISKTSQIYIF
jgi:hypothetical protein